MVNEKRETESVLQVLTWNPKMRFPFTSLEILGADLSPNLGV